MKKYKIAYWITTTIIFLFEGLAPGLTSQTEVAKEGIRALGYPEYFGVMFTVFKVIGALVLILPFVPKRYKEWAYVGFGIDFICAFVSLVVVNGFTTLAILPVICMVLLVISYNSYHKING